MNRVLTATAKTLIVDPATRAAIHRSGHRFSHWKYRWQRRAALLKWLCHYGGLVSLVLVTFAVLPLLGLLIGGGLLWYFNKKRIEDSEYGTAHWATLRDLVSRGFLFADSGLVAGRVLDGSGGGPTLAMDVLRQYPKHADKQAVRVAEGIYYGTAKHALIVLPEREIVHTSTCGGSGSGKSQCHAIINLLTDRNAILATDCKNELALEVARHRAEVFGHEQIFIAPFGNAPPGFECHALNPFSVVNLQSRHVLSDAILFAQALARKEPGDHQPFFIGAAVTVLDAVISFLFAHAAPSDCNLKKVREITTNPDALRTMAELMLHSDFAGGYLKIKAQQLLSLNGRTLMDVLSTLNTKLYFLDSLAVEQSTHWTTFDVQKLLAGKLDLWIVLPVSRSEQFSPLVRCWLTAIAHLIFSAGVGRPHTTSFYFDESSLLGPDLPILDQMLVRGRAFGMKMHFYWQSVHQIAEVFPDHKMQTFREQMSVEQFMSVSSYQGAKEVSQWIGQTTVRVFNESQTYGWSQSHTNGMQPSATAGVSGSTTRGYQKTGRALIQPEELLQLPPDVTVILKPGCPPILAKKLKAYLASDRAELLAMPFGRSPDLQAAKTFRRGIVVLVLMILGGLVMLHPNETKQFKADVARMWTRKKPPTQETAKQVAKMTAKQRRVERLWQKKEEAQRRRLQRMYDAYQ